MASLVLACVYLAWYRDPLYAISGVGPILLLLVAADVTLGPLLTFIVFDRRKRSLPLDLSCIGTLQFAALLYGLYTVEAGRPHYIVFTIDRFEVVSTADLQRADREAAKGNQEAEVLWFGPRIVAAVMPEEEQRERILFESMSGGRDLQHFPQYYRNYAFQAMVAAGKARPIPELRALNPEDDGRLLDEMVARSPLPESRLGYLPVKGPAADAAMLVDVASGAIQGMVGLRPWR